jgi:hypothetical protein
MTGLDDVLEALRIVQAGERSAAEGRRIML